MRALLFREYVASLTPGHLAMDLPPPRIAGLPAATALLYVLLFASSMFMYTSLWPEAPVISSDSAGYLTVAADMRDGSIDRLHYRPPGYPLLLVISGASASPTRPLFVLSLLLHFASIWILASVLSAAGLSALALSLFGIVLLLPPYVEPAAFVLSENLAAFVLALGFGGLVFWRRRFRRAWLVLGALAIGFSGLVRPTYQALGLVLAAGFILAPGLSRLAAHSRRAMLKAGLAVACTSIVLVGGYASLNYVKFGHFGLSLIVPVDSATLSTRTARFVERLPEEYAGVREVLVRARDADLLRRGGQHTGYGYLSSPGVVEQVARVTGLEGPELARYLLGLNLRLIREAPLEYLYDVSRAFGQYWFPTAGSLANMGSRRAQVMWVGLQFAVVGVFAATLIVLAGGLPYWAVSKRAGAAWHRGELTPGEFQVYIYALAAAIVMYTALASSFFETGDPRYRIPTEGLIVVMAFLGVHMCRSALRWTQRLCESAEPSHRTAAAEPPDGILAT